jgi:hypothetical protein
MTHRTETVEDAIEDHDVTLALTPGQLLVAAVALWLFLRFLRSFRS